MTRKNIHELAKLAGVSIATVSRAFNNSRSIKDETKNKILRIADEIDYKPSPLARGLSTSMTDTIGVILPDLSGEFFTDIIHGIDEEAHRWNKFIIVASSHSQRNAVETLIDFMSSGRVDGVIMMAPQIHKEVPEIIARSRRPVVLINALNDIDQAISISIDNYQGTVANVDHLIEHGYTKIAILKGPKDNCDAEERFLGYRDSLAKHGIDRNPGWEVSGDFSVRSGYYGFLRLMTLADKPRAVFAANDMMALGIYEAAKVMKIKIPEDIAVTGFDDIYLSRLLSPRLTTVHAPIEELGSKAVRYLLKVISGEVNPLESYHEKLSTGLIIGGSCGCFVQNPSPLF
ncbi:MAG: LacI family DNA-binding transcriptional regulator [Ignavibacteriales bacterium]|nr:LacI family DNA-binding transcriptional regulator [Ignavibacteriales bacterium]